MGVNWLSILTIGLSSGVVAASLTKGVETFNEWKKRNKATSFLALQIAFQLEGYAIACGSAISEHRLAADLDGHAGTFIDKIPEPPSYPTSPHFEYLDTNLVEDIFDLPQRRTLAQESAYFESNVNGDHEASLEELCNASIILGSKALDIATALRTARSLPQRNLVFRKWDVRDFFKQELEILAKADSDKLVG